MDNIKSAIKAMCQSMSGGYAAMAAALPEMPQLPGM